MTENGDDSISYFSVKFHTKITDQVLETYIFDVFSENVKFFLSICSFDFSLGSQFHF